MKFYYCFCQYVKYDKLAAGRYTLAITDPEHIASFSFIQWHHLMNIILMLTSQRTMSLAEQMWTKSLDTTKPPLRYRKKHPLLTIGKSWVADWMKTSATDNNIMLML